MKSGLSLKKTLKETTFYCCGVGEGEGVGKLNFDGGIFLPGDGNLRRSDLDIHAFFKAKNSLL